MPEGSRPDSASAPSDLLNQWGEETPEQRIAPYNSNMASVLIDSVSGIKTPAITAHDIGRFTVSRSNPEMSGRLAFWAVHQALGTDMTKEFRVQDEAYTIDTRAKHLGIRIVSLPGVTELVRRGELRSSNLGDKTRQTFLEFCIALFRVNE